MTGVQAVACGLYHSLFLKTDGSVWATGLNLFGELGDGTTIDRNTPVEIMNLLVPPSPSALAWLQAQFGAQASDPAVSGWDADPDHDGLNNLLEYAFNLPPLQPGAATDMTPDTGTSGLPVVRTATVDGITTLTVQFLRRKNDPGLSYTPQVSATLDGNWSPITGITSHEWIDDTWERVTLQSSAPAGTQTLFARVQVAVP